MAADLETQGVARATGNVVDRVQRMRNKLVQLAQDGDDDDRAFATAELQKLTDQYGGLSRPGEDPGRGMGDQSDPNPSPVLTGTTTGPKEKPTFMESLDTAVATTVMNPDKLANPAWRRQMIAEVDKSVTGGVGRKIGSAIGGVFGDNSMSDEALAGYAREKPLSVGERGMARVGGMLAPGLSRGVAGMTERGIMNIPGLGQAAAAAPKTIGALVGATGAAAAGAVQAGAETMTGSQAPLLDRIGEAGRAAVTAAKDPLTLGLGAAGGALFGAGAGIRANNRDVQTIESRGGRVSTFDPGSGGAMDAPLVQRGIDPLTGRVTEFGKGRVAREAAEGVADTLEGRAATAGQQLRTGTEKARASGALTQQVDATPLYRQAMEMVENPMLPRNVRAQIQREIVGDVLEPMRQAQQAVGGNRPLMMTADEMNQLKQKLQYFADYPAAGKPGVAEPHFAGMAHEARQNVGDELGRLNREAATEYRGIEQTREALGVPGGANEPISMSQREGLAGRLGRRGADTRTAGQVEVPEIEAALQRYPELRQYVEAPELLQARANLEFKGPGGTPTGGLGNWLKGIVGRNVDPAVVRLLAPLLMGAGNTVRAAAPANMSFVENLGEGARRKMDQR